MSVNILIIPEHFRIDQFVLKPIIEKMMASLAVRARVTVCMDPKLGGVGEALKWERLREIVDRYMGMTRIFLLIVDRDCDENRRAKLDALEARAETLLEGTDRCFLAENAWQELEVWVLAGVSDLPNDWSWSEIREECDPKENYYIPYAQQQNAYKGPYEGREALAKKAAANYQRIRQLCPEDVAVLETRIRAALQTGQCPWLQALSRRCPRRYAGLGSGWSMICTRRRRRLIDCRCGRRMLDSQRLRVPSGLDSMPGSMSRRVASPVTAKRRAPVPTSVERWRSRRLTRC